MWWSVPVMILIGFELSESNNHRESFNTHCSAGRTCGGSMEISEPQPIAGQFVQVRSLDFAPKAPEIRKSQIIGHDDKEVGSLGDAICSA